MEPSLGRVKCVSDCDAVRNTERNMYDLQGLATCSEDSGTGGASSGNSAILLCAVGW